MFWKIIKDENNNYGYFGIGFMATGKKTDKNFPNTFFFRTDNQYICNQTMVVPTSIMMITRSKERIFEIYWDEIRSTMKKNKHYKYLISTKACLEDGRIDEEWIRTCEDETVKKHFRLLRADEMDRAYLPYMEEDFRWTNAEKEFLVNEMNEKDVIFLPADIKIQINTYRQKNK